MIEKWTREQLEELVRQGKKFRGLKMHGVVFDGLDLQKADFRGAAVPWASFKNCKLQNSIFEGANCTCADFDGANVRRANFKDANMCDAKFDVIDAFGITITMDCKCFSHLKVNTGFWFGLLYYAMLMDPVPSATFIPEEMKEKLSVLMGSERYNTLKNLYATRQL
jgi:pentapeptide repeat protein